jgi:DNA end-binding protein Ku
MGKVGRAALAEMVSHEKENLVLIRAAKGGLIMQVMYYANEIRDFGAIPKAEQEKLDTAEIDLASGLIIKLSSEEFEPEAYTDEYRERVLAMIEEKQKGQKITVSPPRPTAAPVIDLMEALKRSMRETQPGSAKEKTRRARKKA